MFKDYAEFGLAAAAFMLASVMFRNQNPKKASRDRGALAATASFLFSVWHAIVLAIYPGLQDGYFESEQALSELDHESDVYPAPTSHRTVRCSTEKDHFSYAGSSSSDDNDDGYDELDHMFALVRNKKGPKRVNVQPQQSTAADHFTYAATSVEDLDDYSEYDHFNYGREHREAPKTSKPPRSTASDHFSFAGSSLDDAGEDFNDLDHFDYSATRKCEGRRGNAGQQQCSHSTATDHFTYAGASFAEKPERSEYDHFDYGDASPSRPRQRYQGSVVRDHFSYAGSFEEDLPYTSEFDHFEYSAATSRQPITAC